MKCNIKINDEIRNLTIEEVLYVPKLSQNLISIGKLANKGYQIAFCNQKCSIKLSNKLVLQGFKWTQNGKCEVSYQNIKDIKNIKL